LDLRTIVCAYRRLAHLEQVGPARFALVSRRHCCVEISIADTRPQASVTGSVVALAAMAAAPIAMPNSLVEHSPSTVG
jgi:hypothetical protein